MQHHPPVPLAASSLLAVVPGFHLPCYLHLTQIPSDPKLIMSSYEPDRLSKFFLTTVEQQPQRELLLPQDVGVPIR